MEILLSDCSVNNSAFLKKVRIDFGYKTNSNNDSNGDDDDGLGT